MSLFADPAEIETLFTRQDGSYAFARWGRPIAPIVFGVDDATLQTVKGAVEAVVTLAGHQMAETDPELGSNLMFFFFRDWAELLDVPDLDRMIPDLVPLVERLNKADAAHYRAFRFDDQNAIQAAFVFIRIAGAAAKQPAEDLALSQAVQIMLTWGDQAFATKSPLALMPGKKSAVLRPEIAGVIAAGYDRMMPSFADDSSHALRLFARLQAPIVNQS
ncbi:MAG: hypothetical protein MK042_04510 [Cognatishimia sp.]|nr:hypothetical protein [Cognatishimia sp.]